MCPELLKEYKGLFMISDITKGSPEVLTDDEKDTVNVELRDYGRMSPYELRKLSHSE